MTRIGESELNTAVKIAQEFIQTAKILYEPIINPKLDKHSRRHKIWGASMKLTKALERLRVSMRAY